MVLPTIPVPRMAIFIIRVFWFSVIKLHRESPRDDFPVTDEFSREIAWGIEREPDGSVGALGHLAFGVGSAHIGLDPAWAGGIDGDSAGEFRCEDAGDSVESCF